MKFLFLILIYYINNFLKFIIIFNHAIIAMILHTEYTEIAFIFIGWKTRKTIYFAV